MMEDKEMGIVVAESEDEKFWIAHRDNCKKTIEQIPQLIDNLNKELKLNQAILEMIEAKLLKSQ